MLVADEFGIVAIEMTAVSGCKIVFRVDPIDIGRLLEVLIGPETVVDDDGFTEFRFDNAVDGVGPGFVFEHCPTGHKTFAFRGHVLAFTEEYAAIVFDHEVD